MDSAPDGVVINGISNSKFSEIFGGRAYLMQDGSNRTSEDTGKDNLIDLVPDMAS